MRRGNMFGPMVIFACLLAFVVMIITFMPMIFGEAEAAVNVTNMSNETHAAYNATSDIVQAGHESMYIVGLIIVAAFVVFGLFLFTRMRF